LRGLCQEFWIQDRLRAGEQEGVVDFMRWAEEAGLGADGDETIIENVAGVLETLRRSSEGRRRLRALHSFPRFLTRCAGNFRRSLARKRRRYGRAIQEARERLRPAEASHPLQAAIDREVRSALAREIAALSRMEGLAALYVLLRGYSHEEAAELMWGQGAGARGRNRVSKLVERARARLAIRLARFEVQGTR
jgi:DNA-directed RNA polymerase specialized sigma24 family protein